MSSHAEAANAHSEAEWESHKDNIKALYLTQDRRLLGKEGVQEVMKIEHRFNADKYQYEKHFKLWKFRKNLTKEEWQPIRKKILARKRDGKDSEVRVEGTLVPAKKVKRAIARTRDTSMTIIQADAPLTPEGVEVTTPVSVTQELFVYQSLPIGRYLKGLFDKFSSPNHHSTLKSTFRHFTDTFFPLTETGEAAFESSAISSVDFSTLVTRDWNSNVSADIIPQLFSSMQQFEHQPEFAHTLTGLYFMIFQMSNGYLNSASREVRLSVIDWLRKDENSCFIHQVVSVRGSTADAAREALFPYALMAGNISIVRYFLELGCDPNASWGSQPDLSDKGSTALGISCETGSCELVDILLAAGADPNQLSQPHIPGNDMRDNDSPAECPLLLSLCKRQHLCIFNKMAQRAQADDSSLTMIKSLLKSGALLNGTVPAGKTPLIEAVRLGLQKVVSFWLEAGANVNMHNSYKELPLTVALEMLDDEYYYDYIDSETATLYENIMQQLIRAGANIDPTCGSEVDRPFDIAARSGSMSLIKTLYAAGARPGPSAIASAIEGDNISVVEFAINHGAAEEFVEGWQSRLLELLEPFENLEMFTSLEFYLTSSTIKLNPERLREALAMAIEQEKDWMDPGILHTDLKRRSLVKVLGSALCFILKQAHVATIQLLRLGRVKANSYMLRAALETNSLELVKTVLGKETSTSLWTIDDKRHQKCCYKCKKILPLTPMLIVAIHHGNLDIFKYLLGRVNAIYDSTALIEAIACENTAMIVALLEAGSPASPTGKGTCRECDPIRTPLHEAIQTRQPFVVQQLLKNYDCVNTTARGWGEFLSRLDRDVALSQELSPLQLAVHGHTQEIATMLLRAGADINDPFAQAKGESALVLAIRRGSQEMLDFVLDQGADQFDAAALLAAVSGDDLQLVQRWLQYSSKLGRRYQGTNASTALVYAILKPSIQMVELLLSHGICPNSSGIYQELEMTALGFAIIHPGGPFVEAVRALLKAKADPNTCIEEPSRFRLSIRTPLIAAAIVGHVSVVEMLIQYGGDANDVPRGSIRRSPLQAACESNNLRTVRLLLEHGADVNTPAALSGGGTALQLAAITGNLAVILALLERGADVNAPPARVNGRTALEGAAEHGRLDTVRLLLDANVAIDGPYKEQYERAIEYAEQNGYSVIKRELLDYAVRGSA